MHCLALRRRRVAGRGDTSPPRRLTSQCHASATLRLTSPSHCASSLGRTLPLLHPTLPLSTRRSLCHTFQNNAFRDCALPLLHSAMLYDAIALPYRTMPSPSYALHRSTSLYFALPSQYSDLRGQSLLFIALSLRFLSKLCRSKLCFASALRRVAKPGKVMPWRHNA